ncbi:MAG: hypothetical protein SGJ10_10065 [Bacteroidota bacterium]|nr:hypothetical protein [Bacteroidota bacterium]
MKVYLLTFFVISSALLNAQAPNQNKIKKVKLSSVYVQFGVKPLSPSLTSASEFEKLAPNQIY